MEIECIIQLPASTDNVVIKATGKGVAVVDVSIISIIKYIKV